MLHINLKLTWLNNISPFGGISGLLLTVATFSWHYSFLSVTPFCAPRGACHTAILLTAALFGGIRLEIPQYECFPTPFLCKQEDVWEENKVLHLGMAVGINCSQQRQLHFTCLSWYLKRELPKCQQEFFRARVTEYFLWCVLIAPSLCTKDLITRDLRFCIFPCSKSRRFQMRKKYTHLFQISDNLEINIHCIQPALPSNKGKNSMLSSCLASCPLVSDMDVQWLCAWFFLHPDANPP